MAASSSAYGRADDRTATASPSRSARPWPTTFTPVASQMGVSDQRGPHEHEYGRLQRADLPTARFADRMNAAQKPAASRAKRSPPTLTVRPAGPEGRYPPPRAAPRAIEQPARTGHGDAEGPQELDRYHDTDGRPADRLVEAEVHRQQAEGQRKQGKPVALRGKTDQPGPSGGQYQRGQGRAQPQRLTTPTASMTRTATAEPACMSTPTATTRRAAVVESRRAEACAAPGGGEGSAATGRVSGSDDTC